MKKKIILNDGTILIITDMKNDDLYYVEWVQGNELLDDGYFYEETLERYDGNYESFVDEYMYVI